MWKTFTHKLIGTPPKSDLEHVEENAGRYSLGFGAQNIGDQIVSAKTVLPWFLGLVGSPAWVTPLLVPIRESGSMLPQAALRPWIQSRSRRLPLLLLGSAGQGLACVFIALTAMFARGALAGVLVLASLALLSLCRALVSLTSKDISGRTVPKGFRGRLTGFATTLSGGVAIIVGIALQALHDRLTPGLFAVLFIIAAASWGLSLWFFKGIRELGGSASVKKQVTEETKDQQQAQEAMQTPSAYVREVVKDIRELLAGDRNFRAFVLVRTLLLTSALSPTFLVAMAADNQHRAGNSIAATLFTGLGTFVIASGVASLLAGRISGWLSDVSSRNTLAGAALLATVVLIVTVVLAFFISLTDATTSPSSTPRWLPQALMWWLPVAFFIVSLAHAAIRVARSTYVVDMAEGDQRTRYVSVANTLMGVLLLLVGALTSLLAVFNPVWPLAALAALGLLGSILAKRLPDVSVDKNALA
ncbi:MFS transporter [Corynebacterium auriscanis]|uniref:MFS transporter n=1 Tax=Corynebacterium auriscanis TaxID=99807 RepID=UPI0022477173|nr:MFS transporter [Corynebacterium auriscanis]MCX2162349.1 MFS transporter [Corynebacterium auriscanis]